jgi:hypothetical protein
MLLGKRLLEQPGHVQAHFGEKTVMTVFTKKNKTALPTIGR